MGKLHSPFRSVPGGGYGKTSREPGKRGPFQGGGDGKTFPESGKGGPFPGVERDGAVPTAWNGPRLPARIPASQPSPRDRATHRPTWASALRSRSFSACGGLDSASASSRRFSALRLCAPEMTRPFGRRF